MQTTGPGGENKIVLVQQSSGLQGVGVQQGSNLGQFTIKTADQGAPISNVITQDGQIDSTSGQGSTIVEITLFFFSLQISLLFL